MGLFFAGVVGSTVGAAEKRQTLEWRDAMSQLDGFSINLEYIQTFLLISGLIQYF